LLLLIYGISGTAVPDTSSYWYVDDLYRRQKESGTDIEGFVSTDNVIYAAAVRVAEGKFGEGEVVVVFDGREYPITSEGLSTKLNSLLMTPKAMQYIRSAALARKRKEFEEKAGVRRAES
jgi:hypothetical protein